MKNALTITQQGAPYLEAREEQRREMVFRTPQGEEVLRVVKQIHKWSGRGEEYHGMRPDGSEAWHVKLHRGLTGTDYGTFVDFRALQNASADGPSANNLPHAI